MAKNSRKKAAKKAKKESAKAGKTLAGRVLAHPRSSSKDKKLAAAVLSKAAQGKQAK